MREIHVSTEAIRIMRAIYFFLLASASLCTLHFVPLCQIEPLPFVETISEGMTRACEFVSVRHQDNAPQLELKLPGAPEHFTWGTQMRYTINVSDPKDGESRYGEIDARACLLEIEYIPAQNKTEMDERIKRSLRKPEHTGLSLMKRSTCFGCHADKTRLAGPSFEEISGKYENNSDIAAKLGQNIIDGSSGIWGDQMMPSHPDLTIGEATQIADYILEQGGNKNRWIYPGLEGSFRTIEKPATHDHGVYLLTASYTSTSNIRGEQSVVFKIK